MVHPNIKMTICLLPVVVFMFFYKQQPLRYIFFFFLKINVSFQKSWPSHFTWSTDFALMLTSKIVTANKKVWIIFSNQVMLFGKRRCCRVIQMYFLGGALSTTSRLPCSSIISERRHASWRLIPPNSATCTRNSLAERKHHRLEEKCVFLT